MIYTCWNCGWRINQRNFGESDNPRIGKHLLYDHHAFCCEGCIINYSWKTNKKAEPTQDWEENGVYGKWKEERKVRRVRNKKKK
jgi:hypothetical protein